MSQLDRWIQGIHMVCPKCGKVQQGVIVITNDDDSGLTTGVRVECCECRAIMHELPIVRKKAPTEQGELNV